MDLNIQDQNRVTNLDPQMFFSSTKLKENPNVQNMDLF